jgi:hypothetical protein
MKIEFSRQIFEMLIPNFVKILPVGDELLHVEGQSGKTDEQT